MEHTISLSIRHPNFFTFIISRYVINQMNNLNIKNKRITISNDTPLLYIFILVPPTFNTVADFMSCHQTALMSCL